MSFDALLDELESKIGVDFPDKTLLRQSMTHPSWKKRNPTQDDDNQRLEFFGDAVLKLLVSEYLVQRYPAYREGNLTKLRAKLVADESLAWLARRLSLGKYVRMTASEKRAGGAERNSSLADAFEALLGAIYLGVGFEAVQSFFIPFFESHYDDILKIEKNIDYKSELQEWLQQKKCPLPDYQSVKETGPDHRKSFTMRVQAILDNTAYQATGVGQNKKEAEQRAAKELFRKLTNQPEN